MGENKKGISCSKAIEEVMKDNNCFASLKHIYEGVRKYKNINGKNPKNTIRERLQRDKRFMRIVPGIWALKGQEDKIPDEIIKLKNEKEKRARTHSEIQGMLLIIGNNKKNEGIKYTYAPDKSKVFDGKKLVEWETIRKVPNFTYPYIINGFVKYFDVIWFNERKFPEKIFEVEHSTRFKNAFHKFMELQDFVNKKKPSNFKGGKCKVCQETCFEHKFICVADKKKKKDFENRLNKGNNFNPIKTQVKFMTYEEVEIAYDNSLKKIYF